MFGIAETSTRTLGMDTSTVIMVQVWRDETKLEAWDNFWSEDL